MAIFRAIFITLVLSFASTALSEEDQATPQTLEELVAELETLMSEGKVPGAGLAIVQPFSPPFTVGLGKANLEQDIDADADTLFRIGSTSKMFVALAVLKLVEEGQLSLDDTLAELAPEIAFENAWEATDPVRLVHLLEHTTGWDDLHLVEYAHSDPTPATLKQGLDFHPHSRVSRWVPGSRMAYCNSGPPVAAYIVQKITGMDFEDYVQREFFDPLGMKTASYRLSEAVREKGATLYSRGTVPDDYWHIIMRPSGSINASARDMARFLQFYIDRGEVDGRPLISRQSLKRMETPASTSAAQRGQLAGYALHNYSSPHKKWVFREHNGGVNGGLTQFAYLPDAGVGMVLMINSGNGEAFGELSELVQDYLVRGLAAPEIPGAATLDDDDRAMAGFYRPINPRQEVSRFFDRLMSVRKLSFEDGKLLLQAPMDDWKRYFIPAGDGVFLAGNTGISALTRTTDPIAGEVVHINTRVMKKTSAASVFGQWGLVLAWVILSVVSILFAPVWLIRKRLGREFAPGSIAMRTWPTLASVSALVFTVLLVISFADPFGRLGAPTVYSVGMMLASVFFALFAALGLVPLYRYRNTEINRAAHVYCGALIACHLVAAGYLAWFGMVGIRTWA